MTGEPDDSEPKRSSVSRAADGIMPWITVALVLFALFFWCRGAGIQP